MIAYIVTSFHPPEAPGNAAPLQRVKVEPVAPERPLATPSPPKESQFNGVYTFASAWDNDHVTVLYIYIVRLDHVSLNAWTERYLAWHHLLLTLKGIPSPVFPGRTACKKKQNRMINIVFFCGRYIYLKWMTIFGPQLRMCRPRFYPTKDLGQRPLHPFRRLRL